LNDPNPYSVAVDWFERTNSLDEALQIVEAKRKQIWRPSDIKFLGEVEHYIRQFWSAGIKWKVFRTYEAVVKQ